MENCTYTNPLTAIILLVITWLQLIKKKKKLGVENKLLFPDAVK